MKSATQTSSPLQTEIPFEHLQLVGNVQRVFEASGYPDLQLISINVQQGEVALYGRVANYFQKQLAQELVKRVCGVLAIRNELLVASKHV